MIQLSKGKEKKVYLFLLSDLVVISKQKTVKKEKRQTFQFDYQTNIPVESCVVESNIATPQTLSRKDSKASTPPNSDCFKLINKADGKEYVWKASSAMDRKGWVKDIQSAIESCQDTNEDEKGTSDVANKKVDAKLKDKVESLGKSPKADPHVKTPNLAKSMKEKQDKSPQTKAKEKEWLRGTTE